MKIETLAFGGRCEVHQQTRLPTAPFEPSTVLVVARLRCRPSRSAFHLLGSARRF